MDWDTVFNVQGNPEIKALFHIEYKHEGGHADFIYLRKTIEALGIEEKSRDKMVKQAIDRMMHPENYVNLTVDPEVDRKKKIEILNKEEQEIDNKISAQDNASNEGIDGAYNPNKDTTTITIGNKYDYKFAVPIEVCSNPEYREYLNYAQNMKSVKVIVDEYYRKYGRRENMKPPKKKHWWQ